MKRDTELRIVLAFIVLAIYFILFMLAIGAEGKPNPTIPCQLANPIPVPGGGECITVGCRWRGGSFLGYSWQCPAGWQVVNGQAVPWNP